MISDLKHHNSFLFFSTFSKGQPYVRGEVIFIYLFIINGSEKDQSYITIQIKLNYIIINLLSLQ